MKVCSLCQRCYDDEAVLCIENGHPALPEPRSRDRHCVAGYSLECLLKCGQGWETYRAAESVSGQPCLIRILSPDARTGEQFLGEATLAAAHFNPNIADVYEAGILDGGEFFAVTEETEGQTVRQLLNTSGWPKLLTTVEIIRQTAEALYELHAGGLVHRAIRPENIVLTTDSDNSLFIRLQCPDFGGAIERSIVSNKFLIDTALDSLRYYAPEQFTGEPATPQTDLYSLGIVLFEMLAGTPPFDAPKATALIAKHRNQPPPELRIADFNLRMLLTHTLKESLHKQARLRQSSANAFARQLRHIEQLATHVSTPPPAGTVPIPTRERPVVIATAASAPGTSGVRPEIHIEDEHPVEIGMKTETAPMRSAGPVVQFETSPQLQPEVLVPGPDNNAVVEEIEKTEPSSAFDRSPLKFRKRRSRSKVLRTVQQIADEAPVSTTDSELLSRVPTEAAVEGQPSRSGIKLPDRNEVAAAMREALAARSTRPVKKIELRLYDDDDIPTDADALQSAAIEQAVDLMLSPPKRIETAAPVAKVPTGIEWQQPEDDIPSEADVLDALSQDDLRMPVEVNSWSAAAGAAPEREAPMAKIERVPEIQDRRSPLPVLVDTLAVVTAEEPAETFVEPVIAAPSNEGRRVNTVVEKERTATQSVPTPVHERAFATPVLRPTRIEFDEPVKDRWRRDEIIEIPASEDPDRTPMIENDSDEITLVAPPSRRIRIDLKQPGRWKVTRRAGSGDTFVPTLLGSQSDEVLAALPDPDHKDPILSVYYGAADHNRRSPYRSLVMGGGFLVTVVILLFGNVLVREEASTEAPVNTVAAKTFPPQAPPTQPARSNFVPAVKENPSKVTERSTESDVSGERNRGKRKEDPVTNKEQARTSGLKGESQNRPTRSASTKPVNEKPSIVPSTVVISSNNGKVSSKVEPQAKPAVRSSSVTNKKSSGTRPRIVIAP